MFVTRELTNRAPYLLPLYVVDWDRDQASIAKATA